MITLHSLFQEEKQLPKPDQVASEEADQAEEASESVEEEDEAKEALVDKKREAETPREAE